MTLDLDLRAGHPAAPPTTVWVQTVSGVMETTIPRPIPVFLVGAGKPTLDVGVDGSVYLDYESATFYGPRHDDLWPPLGRLVPVHKDGAT